MKKSSKVFKGPREAMQTDSNNSRLKAKSEKALFQIQI